MIPRVVLTSLMVALTTFATSGCVINRTAERAFLSGDPGTAMELLRVRSDQATTSHALEENLLGTTALVAGDYETARRSLVTAGRIMGSFPETGAREVAAIVGRESSRLYLGDPYEAVMNSLYAAVALLLEGDEQNARAALKSGILADSDSEEEQYRSDAIALYLLEALLSFRAGVTDLARKDLEQVHALDPRTPFASEAFLRDVNTIVVVDTGIGPRKIATGLHGSTASFSLPPSPERAVRLSLDGHPIGSALCAVDIDFQARTRGGRPMDLILKGKAVLKEVSQQAGAVLLDEGARTHDPKKTGLGATLLAISLLTQSKADTRHWHLLPAGFQLWMGRIEPGLHSLQLEFRDDHGAALPGYQQVWHYLPFADSKSLNVYYFRSGFHKGFRRTRASREVRAEHSQPRTEREF